MTKYYNKTYQLLQIEKIDNNYIADVIKSVIKRGKVINTKEITEAGLKDIIKKYPFNEYLRTRLTFLISLVNKYRFIFSRQPP